MKKKEKIKHLEMAMMQISSALDSPKSIWGETRLYCKNLIKQTLDVINEIDTKKEEWEPFDADKWTPDRVVKTIDGRGVRVIFTKRIDINNRGYSIVALVDEGDAETVSVYNKQGIGTGLESSNLMMLKLPE